jgi:hypothetical protein
MRTGAHLRRLKNVGNFLGSCGFSVAQDLSKKSATFWDHAVLVLRMIFPKSLNFLGSCGFGVAHDLSKKSATFWDHALTSRTRTIISGPVEVRRFGRTS